MVASQDATMQARRTPDPGDTEGPADQPENLERERWLGLIAWVVAVVGLVLIVTVILVAR
jgi:hypothetical protein